MPAPSVVCLVNSVAQTVRQEEFEVTREINTRDTLVASLRQVRPSIGQSVLLYVNSVAEFGGLIRQLTERGHATNYYAHIAATSWEVYCDTVYVTATFAAGQTVAQVVTSLHGTYLAAAGITLTAVTDATVLAAQTFTREPLTSVLGKLAGLSAAKATWRISPLKVMSWEAAGATAAAWGVDASSLDPLGDVQVTQDVGAYANRVRVVGGSYRFVPYVQASVGNSSRMTYPLDFEVGGPWGPACGGSGLGGFGLPVYVNSVQVGTMGTYTGGGGDATWSYRLSDNTVVHKTGETPLTAGQTLTFDTMVQYPAEVVSQDDAEIAANGVWEAEPVLYPDVFAFATLKASATAILASRLPIPTEVSYETRRSGIVPGVLQSIVLPRRNLNGSFLVQGANLRGDGNGRLRWTIRATSVIEARPGELALYETWAGGGSASAGGGVTNATVVAASAALHAHLGGSRSELLYTASALPIVGWQTFKAPATGVYTFRTERCVESGGTVTTSLYDLTAAAVVAGSASSASGSTTWVTAEASVTLTAGHLYQAQVTGNGTTYGVLCGQATVIL